MKRLNLSIEKYESSLLTIPEIDLDVEYYKSSKFTFNKPAFALFKDDTNLEIEVYAEPVYVRFSDKHLNSFGVPLFNITGIGGVKFAEIK